MAGKHFHLSNGSLFFTWLIAGIVVFLLPRHITSNVWNTFRRVFSPVLQIGRPLEDGFPAAPLAPAEGTTDEQYRRLWKDYNNLKATLRQLHADYNDLAAVRSQLPSPYGGLVMARVVGTLSSYQHDVVINKGLEDHVQKGQYVLSAEINCVIGVILESAPHYAKLRMLTDSKQSIEIRIVNEAEGRDITGLMFGDGKAGCKIRMIEREKRVQPGDVVYAAARPGFLNVPMVIGEVAAVVPDEEHPLLWDITVQPAMDMTELDAVAVIVIEDF